MAAINPITAQRIKAYLETFIENKVEDIKRRRLPIFDDLEAYMIAESSRGRLKPFHAAIIPKEIMRINAFERSFSTTLGTTFEECARLIALDHHDHAERSYDFRGLISTSALNEIEHQVAYYDRNTSSNLQRPTLNEMITAALAARGDDLEERTVRADLYVRAKDGTEYFFEIKSPKPNKGQCLEVTQRILRFHLLSGKERPAVKAYFAMAYNPYGPTREDYGWTIPQSYMPFDQGVVIGHEFWDIIGGPTTYTELLEMYQTVGKEKSKYMVDALAFGF